MNNIHDLIIIGGGPAALAAAYYARSKRLNTVMLYEELGGKLGWRQRWGSLADERHRADRGSRQLGDALQHDIRDWEAESLPGNEVVRLLISRSCMQAAQVVHDRAVRVTRAGSSFETSTEQGRTLCSAAVIVASGAAPRPLDVPGSWRSTGVSFGYSATTYAHRAAGKHIAVIGGSHRALRGALELARTAARVYLVVPDDGLQEVLIERLRRSANLECITAAAVKEVIGGGRVEGLVIEHAGRTRTLAVEHVFVDFGLLPNTAMIEHLGVTDADGFVVVDAQNATAVPGLFAAGDVTTAFGEQVLIAVGDGVRAAMSAYDYLLRVWLADDIPDAVTLPEESLYVPSSVA
jgi:thioredoxin reductase